MSGKTYYVDNSGIAHQIKKKVRINSSGIPTQLKKKFFEGKNIFSSSHIVTYHVNTNDVRTIEVDDGGDAIISAPTTGIPTGWILVGWREDTTASATVLPNKSVTTDGLHLYAVLRQAITITYYGNGNTGGSTAAQTMQRYYNNGNVVNPTFTLRANGFTKTQYAFDYWNQGSTSGTARAAGSALTLSASTNMYAHWSYVKRNIVLVDGNVSTVNGNVWDWNIGTYYLTGGEQLHVYVKMNANSGMGNSTYTFSCYGTPYSQGNAIGGRLYRGGAGAQLNLAWSVVSGRIQVANEMVGTGWTSNDNIYVKIWIN